MDDRPAILGGQRIWPDPITPYLTIGQEERQAVTEVLDSGLLSGFLGFWDPQFFGGPKVRELEQDWSERFGTKHAVAVNSATSGLIAAVGALGIGPGDEVIVTPCTMSATVSAIVHYQAIPVFADICPHTFCIDPADVERKITDQTKAIVGVDIYGEAADWDALSDIAQRHGLKTLEDAAQAPGGTFNGRNTGTLGDIGIYSLNRHKHVHCGEGGVCVTDDDELADRLRLIRNHAEAVVEGKGTSNLVNLVGYNFRITEIEAAIAVEQLKKLDDFVEQRRALCSKLIEAVGAFDGISPPIASPLDEESAPKDLCRSPSTSVKHVYYLLGFKLDRNLFGLSRNAFVKALKAEGFPATKGGYKPVYLEPMYQQKIAYGRNGHPFTADYYGKEIDYSPGICPVAERVYYEEFFDFPAQSFFPSDDVISRIVPAIERILSHRDAIELLSDEE